MELSGQNYRSLSAILLWGSFGGVCSAAAYFLLQWIWDHYLPCAAVHYSLYYHTQVTALFALIFVILGFFAGTLFCSGKNSREIRIGMISGICTALVFMAIIAFQNLVLGSADFSHWPILIAEVLVASVILQTIGTYFHKSRCGSAPDDKDISHKYAITKIIHSYWFLFLAILAVLIIPPVCLGMSTGGVAEELRCFVPINDRVDVTRTAPDSIRLVMQPDSGIKHDVVPSVKIFLNEKDASNQSIIMGSGLDAVINPSEGLPFQRKASVTLQGRDVSGNETVPVHLQIIVTYPNRGIRYVICDMQI
jgi:hypothetical protein